MGDRTSAEASVEVGVDAHTAFTIFTSEIDLWWVRGPINHFDASRLVELRLEPGLGGRMLEIYDESAGDVLEVARITGWEPGERLLMRDVVQDTEIDVRFTASAAGTWVTVRQSLRPGGEPERVGFGWVNMIGTYQAWVERRETAPRAVREVGRLGIALCYTDPRAAVRWLRDVFGLGSWDVDVTAGETDLSWIELHIGDSLLILLESDGEAAPTPSGHNTWVFVDDLDAHFERARAGGATIVSPIQRCGSRTYVAEDLEGHRWTFVQARPTMR